MTEIFLFPPTWVPAVPQWDNYAEVWRRVPFGRFTLNTLTIALLSLLGTLLTSSLVAYSFARFRYLGRNVFFMLTLSTMMLPYEVTLIPTYLMYNKVGWLDTYLPLIVPYWFGGNRMMIFLAGLQGVPSELVDAAQVDGANAWQRFRHVTLPMITPTIFFNLILGIIGALQVFTTALIATNGGPAYATWFYALHLYKQAFDYQRLGYAAALAWIFLVVVLLLTLLNFAFSRKWVYYRGGT